MNAFRVLTAPQVAVDLLGEVRAIGGEQPGEPAHDVVDRLVRKYLLLALALEPHAGADELDVPAREVFENEVNQLAGGTVELASFHRFIDNCRHRVDPGDDEPVLVRHPVKVCPDVFVIPDPCLRLRLELVKDHIREREAVHVPEDVDSPVDRAHAFPVELEVVPRGGGREDIEAEDIDPDFFDDIRGVHHVPEALRHLLALGIESESVHADTLVRGFAKSDGTGAELRVEPAPGLVLPFRDEVRGPEGVELCGSSRVPERCPRGDCRVEPDIEDVLDPFHRTAALARDRDLVHVRAVGIGKGLFAQILKFLDRTNHAVHVAFRADPDRDRDAPVALARDAPVTGFLNPVVEPGTPGPLGIPCDLLHF